MPEINAATGALTIPIWAVGAVAAVFLVLMLLAIAQAGTATVMNTLFRAVIVIALVTAGWLYVEHTERQEHAAVRRALDDRSAALLAGAVAPGSALSCLNELAGEAVEAACEKAVFSTPEAVSAAVSYVTEELSLLSDGTTYAVRVNPAYMAELVPLRTALQLDRFGIVAHVLAGRGCTAEKCDTLSLLEEPSRVLANLRDHAFDDQVTKYTAVWNTAHAAAASSPDTVAAAPSRALPASSKYDFPSSDSIPPVNIMAPEPSRGATTPEPGSRTVATPMPPRRPQRPPVAVRSTAQRAAPVAVGETPTDGAGTPSSQ